MLLNIVMMRLFQRGEEKGKKGHVISYVIVSIFVSLFLVSCSSGGGGSDGGSNGDSVTEGTNISNTPTDSAKPVVAADSGGNVYLSWEETFPDPHTEVYLAKSSNFGLSFSAGKSLTKGSVSNPDSISSISMTSGDDDSLYFAWINSLSAGGTGVKFFRETSPPSIYVSDITGNVDSPHIALNGSGKIHVVWAEDLGGQKDIFYRRSEDNGDIFLPSDSPMNIANTPSDSSEPLLGFDGSLNINVTWSEGSEGGRSVAFSRSMDSGNNFLYPQTASGAGIDSYCPAIATHGDGKIYIAYKGNSRIYFVRWQASTSSFSTPINISPNSSSPSCPEMAVSSNGLIYAVWSDSGRIWVAISSDAGYTFAPPVDISSKEGASSLPKIAMDGPYINIIWVEEAIGMGDIYLSGSADNGKSFSSPQNISNSPTSPSTTPAVTSNQTGYIYIAWEEGTAGSREIYFKRDRGARGLSQPKRPLARFLDISGDGKSDIVIGAPTPDGIGKVYLFYSDLPPLLNMASAPGISTSSANYTLSGGSPGDQFGFSTAIAGDINGDGYADILVGAPYADDGATDNGKVYIYYGGPSSKMNSNADIIINGSDSGENMGFSVSPAGDVNGDGFDDIMIGAPNKYQSGIPYAGAAYIFYGGPLLSEKTGYPNISSADADVILKGEESQDKFGSAVSWAGDFNGDKYDDVVVGAPSADGEGNSRGRTYIYYGGTSMNSQADVRITGKSDFDWFGSSVAGGGDINNDGYGDVIIGAPGTDYSSTGDDRGKAYVIYGGGSVGSDINVGSSISKLTVLSGPIDKAYFGTSVGYAGDVNNDGFGDVVAGGKYLGTDDSFKGRAYLYLGGSSMNTAPDAEFSGEDQTDRFGTAVAGIGDVDGDSYYDILIGAYLAEGEGSNKPDRGKSYLYLGAPHPDNAADATFTGVVNEGWAGYSLYKHGD